MEIAAPVAVHTRAGIRPGHGFTLDSPSIGAEYPLDPLDRVSDEDEKSYQDRPASASAFDVGEGGGNHLGLTIEEEEEVEDDSDSTNENEAADETRLRYERLQARGRAAELAYALKQQQQKELEEATKQHSKKSCHRDRSKSGSRPSTPATPIFSALFKRDTFALGGGSHQGHSHSHNSQSPPVSSVAMEKATRRSSVTNLFGLMPLSRSSSSKSIHSGSSSVTNSPFPSPLTPLSPLPSFKSPKTRRKAISNAGDDVVDGSTSPAAGTSTTFFPGVTATIGSPLTRTPRRPSPSRAMTLPDPGPGQSGSVGLEPSSSLYVTNSPTTSKFPLRRGSVKMTKSKTQSKSKSKSKRDASPLGRSDNVIVPAPTPHLVHDGDGDGAGDGTGDGTVDSPRVFQFPQIPEVPQVPTPPASAVFTSSEHSHTFETGSIRSTT